MPKISAFATSKLINKLVSIQEEKSIELEGDKVSLSSIIIEMIELGIRLHEHSKSEADKDDSFDMELILKSIYGRIIEGNEMFSLQSETPKHIRQKAFERSRYEVQRLFNKDIPS